MCSIRPLHFSFAVGVALLLFCLGPTKSALAGLAEDLACVAKYQKTATAAARNEDHATVVSIINRCLSNTVTAHNNATLRNWLASRVSARTRILSNATLKRNQLAESDIVALLHDMGALRAQDFHSSERLLFHDVSLQFMLAGHYRLAQHLLPLAGEDGIIENRSPALTVIVLYMLAASTTDASEAKRYTLRAKALEAKLTPSQQLDIRANLAPYYVGIGQMEKALALIKIDAPDAAPCNTPQKMLKILQYKHTHREKFDKYQALYIRWVQASKATSYNKRIWSELLELEEELVGELSYLKCSNIRDSAVYAYTDGDYLTANNILLSEIERRKIVFGENASCTQEVRLEHIVLILQQQGEYKKALEQYISILSNSTHPQLQAETLYRIMDLAFRIASNDITNTFAHQLLLLSRQIKNTEYELSALHMLTLVAYLQGSIKQGDQYFAQAEQLVTQLGDGWDKTTLYTTILTMRQEYARALPFLQQIIDSEKRIRGLDNADSAVTPSTMEKLFCLLKLGRQQEVMSPLFYVLEKNTQLAVNLFPLLSAEQAEKTLADYKPVLNLGLGLLSDIPAFEQKYLFHFYRLWLQNKGLLLEAQGRMQVALTQALPPALRQQKQNLDKLRLQVEHLPPAQQADMNIRIAKQESALKLQLPNLLTYDDIKRVTPEAIVAALPPKTVLIDFAKVLLAERVLRDSRTFPDVHKINTEGNTLQYIAFVLAPSGALTLVRLGDSQKIETAIAAYRRAIQRDPGENGALLRKHGEEVYLLLFAPLRDLVDNAEHLYISADGQINTLPFETIPVPQQDAWLIDKYTFSYLSAPRDLLRQSPTSAASGPALIVGNPDFAMTSGATNTTTGAHSTLQAPAALRGSVESSLRNVQFGPLPATEAEVRAVSIRTAPPFSVYTQREAQKSVLVTPNAPPRHIHLATHGFFLPDDAENIGGQENAMLRSGLAFAGAATPQALAHILLAEEVAVLNLHGTELVVLSACQTGLGDIKNGEGVYGLQRAFALAGAKRLVMSMWAVPDKETGEIMQSFYAGLKAGMGVSTALRAAMLQQKRWTKMRDGYANPLYWGAFVSSMRHN